MKPKIIFLSGVPSSGKTTIARKLALSLNIDKIIDLDCLKYTCCTFVDKNQDPYLWSTSHEAWSIENLSNISGFNKYSSAIQNQLLNTLKFLKKEKYIIVEGAQLTPKILQKIAKNEFNFIYFYIYPKNKNKLIKNINKKLKNRQGNWLKNLDKIWEIHEYLFNQKNQIKILNSNLNTTVKKIKKELKNENLFNK